MLGAFLSFLFFSLLLSSRAEQFSVLEIDISSEQFIWCQHNARRCFNQHASVTHRFNQEVHRNVYQYLRQHTEGCDWILERLEQLPWLNNDTLSVMETAELLQCLYTGPRMVGRISSGLAPTMAKHADECYHYEYWAQKSGYRTMEDWMVYVEEKIGDFIWPVIGPPLEWLVYAIG